MSNSSHPNPFAPPRAAVADVFPDEGEAFQPVKIFSAKGRMGRLRYIAYIIAGNLLTGFISGILGFVIAMAGGKTGAVAVNSIVIMSWILNVPVMILYILWGIQRSHDMNWSGWTLLLPIILTVLIYAAILNGGPPPLIFIIPLIGLIWLLRPGSPGPNRFGPPPPPNSTGVKILAGIMPLIFIIGIVAAIAIPAYQQYQARAAAQALQQQKP
ncbi:MAG: DUF805 domain-containing protein [Azonexus sp.]|jgi:uncharacterized membrane protein YhaH (DUF805 family)|nr:DUF805 domain-containing protein [Azonexus sp.]